MYDDGASPFEGVKQGVGAGVSPVRSCANVRMRSMSASGNARGGAVRAQAHELYRARLAEQRQREEAPQPLGGDDRILVELPLRDVGIDVFHEHRTCPLEGHPHRAHAGGQEDALVARVRVARDALPREHGLVGVCRHNRDPDKIEAELVFQLPGELLPAPEPFCRALFVHVTAPLDASCPPNGKRAC